MIKTNLELVKALQNIVDNYKTLYVMGCFGAPLTGSNVARYKANHSYNTTATRKAMIDAAANKNPPVYGFDCVNMIKGIMWGWNGDASKEYGGAKYATNSVPDTNADGMIKLCKEVSTDFSKISVGEALWCSGHIGVYIGDGKAIECTPSWKNCVQVTGVSQTGIKTGLNSQKWIRHGKLPFINYVENKPVEVAPIPQSKISIELVMNGKVLEQDDATGYACLIGDRTLVPIRLVAESLGLTLDWESNPTPSLRGRVKMTSKK